MTPVIGIVTCGFEGNRQFVTDSYISAVCRAGGCRRCGSLPQRRR